MTGKLYFGTELISILHFVTKLLEVVQIKLHKTADRILWKSTFLNQPPLF